jgi:hypothetical protein
LTFQKINSHGHKNKGKHHPKDAMDKDPSVQLGIIAVFASVVSITIMWPRPYPARPANGIVESEQQSSNGSNPANHQRYRMQNPFRALELSLRPTLLDGHKILLLCQCSIVDNRLTTVILPIRRPRGSKDAGTGRQ